MTNAVDYKIIYCHAIVIAQNSFETSNEHVKEEMLYYIYILEQEIYHFATNKLIFLLLFVLYL